MDLGSGVGSGHGDTALTLGVGDVAGEADVALLSPLGTPGVLHDPVVLAGLRAISDCEHTVVEVGAARGVVEDSSSIELEGLGVGLDGNGHGLLGNGKLELSLRVGGHVSECRAGAYVLGALGSRAAEEDGLAGEVLVVISRIDSTVGDHILEGVVHKTTIASLVVSLGVAIEKLLNRELGELSVLDEVGSLEGSGGGESPARSALALVLHRGDGTLGSPIDRVGSRARDGAHILGGIVVDGTEAKHGAELLDGHVSELVKLQPIRLSLGVVSCHGLGVASEHRKAVGNILLAVSLAVLELPGREKLLSSLVREGGGVGKGR